MVATKKYAQENNPISTLQISTEVEQQEDNQGADGARSSSPFGNTSEVRVKSTFIYPLRTPEFGQVTSAWPMYSPKLSILATEDNQRLRSAMEPTDQTPRRINSFQIVQI